LIDARHSATRPLRPIRFGLPDGDAVASTCSNEIAAPGQRLSHKGIAMRSQAREAAGPSSGSVGGQLAELRALIARHAEAGEKTVDGIAATAIDGVFVSAVTGQTEAVAPTSGTILAVIAQGGKRLATGDRVYEYRAGQYLVASVELPITGSHWYATPTEPALGFGLVLRPSTIASLLLDAAQHGGSPKPGRSSSAAAPPGLGVATHRPSCSMRSSACCAFSTARGIARCWRR
jgi:AraC-type transcriptional regulator N-terminus